MCIWMALFGCTKHTLRYIVSIYHGMDLSNDLKYIVINKVVLVVKNRVH